MNTQAITAQFTRNDADIELWMDDPFTRVFATQPNEIELLVLAAWIDEERAIEAFFNDNMAR